MSLSDCFQTKQFQLHYSFEKNSPKTSKQTFIIHFCIYSARTILKIFFDRFSAYLIISLSKNQLRHFLKKDQIEPTYDEIEFIQIRCETHFSSFTAGLTPYKRKTPFHKNRALSRTECHLHNYYSMCF